MLSAKTFRGLIVNPPPFVPPAIPPRSLDFKVGDNMKTVVEKCGYPSSMIQPKKLPGIRMGINKPNKVDSSEVIFVYDSLRLYVAFSEDACVSEIFNKYK